MISPKFKEDYINKNTKELMVERQKIMKEIIKIEKNEFLLKETTESPTIKMLMDPSPEVVWKVLNRDMIMLTDLIDEKSTTLKL